MTFTRCGSSRLMTGLLAWRNPQENEENWILHPQRIENTWKHAVKIIVTEIGLALFIVTSSAETVAYSALGIVSAALYPINDRPFKFFTKLLQSSSFTIIWGVAYAILYNPFFINVMTQESFARFWVQRLNPTQIVIFRLNDRLYVADWNNRHREININDGLLETIAAEGLAIQTLIDQGAHFIQKDILANADAKTLNSFKDSDPSIFMFILTKAVYIYAAGTKKNAEIPDFFKLETKRLILALRQEQNSEKTEKELERLIRSPIEFETTPQEEPAQSMFNKLRNVALGELQNSLLSTTCWEQAALKTPSIAD